MGSGGGHHKHRLHRDKVLPVVTSRLGAHDDPLAEYADPDCPSCEGTGGSLARPCPVCIVAVWT